MASISSLLRNINSTSCSKLKTQYVTRFLSVKTEDKIGQSLEFGSMLQGNPLEIPRLPIPELSDTLSRYLNSVQPHTGDQDAFLKHQALVEDFSKTSGPKLHKLVVDKEKAAVESGVFPYSYIEDLWYTMYLEGRWELPVNSNPYFAMLPWHDASSLSQTQSCARLVSGVLRWLDKVRMSKLEVLDLSCVYQMPLQVATSRIACQDRDELKITPSSGHVIVLSNNRFYLLQVFDQQGCIIAEDDLAGKLDQIKAMSKEGAPQPFVGYLTAMERNKAAAARLRLAQDEHNEQCLKDIDCALYVVSLDDETPEDLSREGKLFLTGDNGKNRWFDKHSIIALGNGAVATNFEHAYSDGVTWNRKLYEAWCWGMRRDPGLGITLHEPEVTNELPPPKELKWNLSDVDKANIAEAEKDFASLAGSCKLTMMDFQEFGKNTLKSWKASPDASVQLAMQLSYTRLHEEIAPVYEACSTAKFLHGRTETIRSCSPESTRFIEMMMSPQTSKAEKVEAFRAAAKKHIEIASLAKEGMGVDRHLLALKSMAQQIPEAHHPLFDDELFKLTSTWILSTSNVTYPQNKHFAFGPVTPQGYGLGYIIDKDWISLGTTSFETSGKTDSKAMADTVGETLLELNTMMSEEN